MPEPSTPLFREVSVTDARSLSLLTQYFSDRQSGFPADQGRYRTTFPASSDFLPPRGVFLLLGEETSDHGREDRPGNGAARTWVGCGGIRRIDDGPDRAVRYEVKHLWLQLEVRGRGWGSALLAELERRARGFGATELVLDTNASLTAAAALYASAGFTDCPPYNDNPNATNWYRKVLSRP
jgi:GNAT superfamily N-acetyltransferase